MCELARTYTAESLAALAAIMKNAQEPARARVAAAEALLNRGWGTPLQHVDVTSRDETPMHRLSDDELVEMLMHQREMTRRKVN